MNNDEKKPTNRISELRKEKGLTLQQVADAIGVGNNTISRYENGKREPNLETWIKLASFFDVPILYLQGITDSKVNFNNIDRIIESDGFDMSKLNSALDDKDIHTYKRLINAYHGRKEPNSKVDPKKLSLLYRDLILENNISDSQKFIEFKRLFDRVYHMFLFGYGDNNEKAREIYEAILKESKKTF